MQISFCISGRLPGLNDYTLECRKHPQAGAKMKRIAQELCEWSIKQRCKVKFTKPVRIHYIFIEPNRRRDKSNVAAFAIKVIEDALVELQVIHDDGWQYIDQYSCEFGVDKLHPRIEVSITDDWED